ncbi:MAG: Verru_Chthon cassette protein A [Verrucomicrobiales bacterium]|nr:Verru_Chthon cassette protein A [Verrucomicrobiales bacterium]
MKIPQKLFPGANVSKNKKGIALVTVLTVMALTTILVLTFFSLATSENRASNTYSNGLQAQQIAEQAINMVIAQIREATADPNDTEDYAWASQPGAIRTWTKNGGIRGIYKLYSDELMKDDDPVSLQNDFTSLATWYENPDVFVDLNEPVIRGEKVYYPIVNPTASSLPEWPKELNGESRGVEGFSFDSTAVPGGPFGEKAATVANSIDGHVAMPVRWLYQLADGTLGVVSETGSRAGGYPFQAISGSGTPAEDNPIVARFAFWTDDETTKLNLNTHAGGLAWDIPKAGGEIDMDMGRHQPAQNEWQRYPGHPATTHLIPALAPGVIDIVNDRDAMEMLFDVVPRVVGGGSESGTRALVNNGRIRAGEENGLQKDSEPLFPSLDDMVMRSDREPHEFPDANGDPIPPDELSEYLERAKFFITTNSRAPEVNVFNLPKVAIWPVYNAEQNDPKYQTHLTAFDRLIHYCSIVGRSGSKDFDYIFKREKADSAVYDYESIERNQELYTYLKELLSREVPGYGASFVDKYGDANVDRLLTMLFDYIRTTNLHDDMLFGEDFEDAFTELNTDNHITYTNPREKSLKGTGHRGHGQVTPIEIDGNKGAGRYYTLASSGIVVATVAEPTDPDNTRPLFAGVANANPNSADQNDPDGVSYNNLPPITDAVRTEIQRVINDNPTTAAELLTYTLPQWLRDLWLEDKAEFRAAREPHRWNWQLMFLDSTKNYASNLELWREEKFTEAARSALTIGQMQEMRLEEDERLVQGSFVFNLFSPSIGWNSITPDMKIEIKKESGMTFDGDDGAVEFIGFERSADSSPNDTYVWATNWSKPLRTSGARAWGGLLSFGYTMNARQERRESGKNRELNVWYNLATMAASSGVDGFPDASSGWDPGSKGSLHAISSSGGGNYITPMISRLTPLDRGYDDLADALEMTGRVSSSEAVDMAQAYRYDLVTVPFKISGGSLTVPPDLSFNAGSVTFSFYNGDGVVTEESFPDDSFDELVQEIEVDFPSFTVQSGLMSPGLKGRVNANNVMNQDSMSMLDMASLTADPANPVSHADKHAQARSGTSFTINANRFGPKGVSYPRGRMARMMAVWDNQNAYIVPQDVVQSVAVPHGDIRLVATQKFIDDSDGLFEPHRDYGSNRVAHAFTSSVGNAVGGFVPEDDGNDEYLLITKLRGLGGVQNPYRNRIPMPLSGNDKGDVVQRYGDFDNGAGLMIDGPYINKPDEGNVTSLGLKIDGELDDTYWSTIRETGDFPYFSDPEIAESGGAAYFSPNRLVSGPGMFGSLPTGLSDQKPWQTLLFRPNVVGGDYTTHPGAEDPPDHMIMDLFWMPVVEPYAISEPLSTAGKVNMNYEIVPFLHINRDTALRGVFRSEYMLCIPNEWHHSYKHNNGRGRGYHWKFDPRGGELQGKKLRSVIVEADTLEQFKERFNNGTDIFKSSTEICDIHLVPQEIAERLGQAPFSVGSYTPTVDQMENGQYWSDHALVGDNSRERPYTNIQQRLTTKSNTFKVHYRAQVVKQARRDDDDYSSWNPLTDTVQAEYRGSSIVERFVDPNDPTLTIDFATEPSERLNLFYQYRVVNPRRFAP